MEELRSGTHEVSDDYYISHEHPEYDILIEWSFEIDLDNLVFHINHTPMFRLDCMPSSDDFGRFISWDHYGERFFVTMYPLHLRLHRSIVVQVPDTVGTQHLL